MPMTAASDATTVQHQHPTFWFDDGSLVLVVEAAKFKVHRTLVLRHSPFLSALLELPEGTHTSGPTIYCLQIDPARRVSVVDFEILLQHLYHDIPLSPDSPFPRIASILRVSAPGQLNFPTIHDTAKRYFLDLFPSGPTPFLHPGHLEEALELSTALHITSVQKGLLYSLVTSTNFDTEDPTSQAVATDVSSSSDTSPEAGVKSSLATESESTAGALLPGPQKHVLSSADAQRCMRLMTHFIEHFTPILFTPPATPHMACTDVFADKWLSFVIHPAIQDDGVYKPLETLERIKGLDWAGAGLCSACVLEKNAEWREEQEFVWRSMDQWLQA